MSLHCLNLDESGIVYIGAEVKGGDILVGKVTPKGETQLTPEEKLFVPSLVKKHQTLKILLCVYQTLFQVRLLMFKYLLVTVLKKTNVHLKLNRCSLKKLRKTLTEEFQILEGGLLNRARCTLKVAYSEAKLDAIDRKKWLSRTLDDDAQAN